MKRIVALILAFVLALSLCACGPAPDESYGGTTREYTSSDSQCGCCCCTNH